MAYVKRDLASRSCQVLSISLAGLVATDDKDDTAEAEGSRAGKERRRKTEGGGERKDERDDVLSAFATTVSPHRRRYRVRKHTAPLFHLTVLSLSLHPSTLRSLTLVPTAACASCSMARKITEPSIVFSLLPLPDRRNFRRRVIRG